MNKPTTRRLIAPRNSYTPGPWHLNERTETGIVGADGRHVATTGGFLDTRIEDGGCAENAANARLIAAAPELLESLIKLVCQVRKTAVWAQPEIDEADALIAKITRDQS